MITQSNDTHPDAERVLISLFRNASPAKKLSHVRSLSRTMIQLSKRALIRANKNLDEQEVNLLFVSLHYGKNIADRLRKYLEKTDHE